MALGFDHAGQAFGDLPGADAVIECDWTGRVVTGRVDILTMRMLPLAPAIYPTVGVMESVIAHASTNVKEAFRVVRRRRAYSDACRYSITNGQRQYGLMRSNRFAVEVASAAMGLSIEEVRVRVQCAIGKGTAASIEVNGDHSGEEDVDPIFVDSTQASIRNSAAKQKGEEPIFAERQNMAASNPQRSHRKKADSHWVAVAQLLMIHIFFVGFSF